MVIPGSYLNSDTSSFAHESLKSRWPAIIDGIIADLRSAAASESTQEKVEEVASLVAQFESLKSDFVAGAALKPLHARIDGAQVFNAQQARWEREYNRGKAMTWANGPWLYTECYLYRKLDAIVDSSQHWKSYDIFEQKKNETFEKSADAVSTLAQRYETIAEQQIPKVSNDISALKVLFHEILTTALWGNATDLSLLVSIGIEEVKKLQVAASHRDEATLLVNDFDKVWKHLTSEKGGRVDIVLDNSGFELYTDLIFALFLLDSGLAEQIVLHPKSIPWFVSDVTPRDWIGFIQLLQDSNKFPNNRSSVDYVTDKISSYANNGQIVVRTSPFWTTSSYFWQIKAGGTGAGDAVWRDLRASKLVFFKGDLNYRKLTGDLMWPRHTPFKEAVQDLATSGINFVTLRVVKADVVVGLPVGKDEEISAKFVQEHPDKPRDGWTWNGSYAVISCLP